MRGYLSWAVLFLGAMLHLPVQAQQASATEPQGPDAKPAATQKKTTKAAQPRVAQPKVLPGGSGETASERAARLKRECKGRPNAGACTGYTQ